MRLFVPVVLAGLIAAVAAHAQAPAAATAPQVTTPVARHHRAAAAHPARTPPAPAPVVPPAAPPPAVIPPPPDLAPPHPTALPPAPVVQTDAPGEASKIAGGLRLTFGDGRADLNPGTLAALQILAHTGQTQPSIVFNLYAHAPGTPEDSSTPRRLSLARALTVRSALIHAGIGSVRIYVHAMGPLGAADPGPVDRVDVTLATLDTTPPALAPKPATP